MVIFNSYVKLPEGKSACLDTPLPVAQATGDSGDQGFWAGSLQMSSREKTRGNTKTAGAAVIAKGTTDITEPYYYYYIIYQYESCDIIFN